MEVVESNVAMLSNYEVYEFLVKSEDKTKKDQNLATITYETKEYLAQTPCTLQSEELIKQVLSALSKYELTKAEKLQLINLRPTYPVDIQLMIEEIEERFNEEQIAEMLKIINNIIPMKDK